MNIPRPSPRTEGRENAPGRPFALASVKKGQTAPVAPSVSAKPAQINGLAKSDTPNDGWHFAPHGWLDGGGGRPDGGHGRQFVGGGRPDGGHGRQFAADGWLDAVSGWLFGGDGRLDAVDGRRDALGGRPKTLSGWLFAGKTGATSALTRTLPAGERKQLRHGAGGLSDHSANPVVGDLSAAETVSPFPGGE